MKKTYQYLFIISLWMVLFTYPLFAEDIYVTGVTSITMRTGPGVEHKIIAILKSGTKLEIIDYQNDWSQVKKGAEKIGWVLSRFLTRNVPDSILLEKLKKNHQDLLSRLEVIERKNKKLTAENAGF